MTQQQRIIEHIKAHGSISPFEAFDLGITRLAACVHDMRRHGVKVVTIPDETVNRYGDKVRFARYTIDGGVPGCFKA